MKYLKHLKKITNLRKHFHETVSLLLVLMLTLGSVFNQAPETFAATTIFTQSSWSGGASTDTALHTNGDYANWNKYGTLSDDGLVGLWHMNGDFNDSSGNGNNGTAQGGAAASGAAKLGSNSGSFDGTDDNITIANESNFDFERTNSFSLEAWIKTTQTSSGQIITKGYSPGADQGFYLAINHPGGEGKVYSYAHGGSTAAGVYGNTIVNDGVWHHIAMTYNGSSQAAGIKLYVDGVLQTNTVVSDNLSTSMLSNTPVVIGNRSGTFPLYFNGLIDEVAIYNRALSASTISTHYNANNGVEIGNGFITASSTSISLKSNSYTATDDGTFSTTGSATNGGFGGGSDGYDKLLLHTNGTDGSPTFTDETGKTVTANGNAQIDTAQSVFGGASALFDGTGDGLSVPDSEDFNFGLGNFTIDAWVKSNDIGTLQVIYGQVGLNQVSLAMSIYNSKIAIWASTNGTAWDVFNGTAWNSTLSQGVWYHIALVRNGSSWKGYVNGVEDWSATANVTLLNSTNAINIGHYDNGGQYFNGWMDEIRVSKGIARWTANFTPPTVQYGGTFTSTAVTGSGAGASVVLATTTPVSYWKMDGDYSDSKGTNHGQFSGVAPDAYTKLQIHTDGADSSTSFIDNTGKAITAYGNTQIDIAQSKFGGASALFDGVGDYLSIPSSTDFDLGAGAFTIDFWVWMVNQTNYPLFYTRSVDDVGSPNTDYYANLNGGTLRVGGGNGAEWNTGLTFSVGAWHHIEIGWNGIDTEYAFVDGVGTSKSTTSYTSGTGAAFRIADDLNATFLNGYIDEFRFSKGILRHSANFTPPTSAYADGSSFGTAKYGTYSGSFDGSNDYVQIPAVSNLNLTTDMTIEGWIYLNSIAKTGGHSIISKNTTNEYTLGIYGEGASMGKLSWGKQGIDELLSNTTLVAGSWYYIAVTRTGGVNYIYINGSLDNSGAKESFAGANIPVNISNGGANWFFNGLIDEVAVYNTALSAQTIASRYNGFGYGSSPYTGTFTSAVIDLGAGAYFDTLSWSATTTASTSITMEARAASTSTMSDATSWTAVTNGGSLPSSFTGKRYFQYRATLSTTDITETPYLNSVTLNYTQYAPNGALISSKYDAGDSGNIITRLYMTTSGTSATETVKIQIRTASSSDGLNSALWCGLADTGSSCAGTNYFTTANEWIDLESNHTLRNGSNDRWFQYKIILAGSGGATPTASSISIRYVVNAAPEFKENGLVGLWHMNGDFNDGSGNGNNGTAQNGAAASGAAKLGSYSGSFDGVDDYVSVPDSANLDITSNITIEGWIKPTTLQNLMSILTKRQVLTTNYAFRTGSDATNDEIQFYYYDGSNFHVYETSNANLVVGNWYHLAVTFTFGTGSSIKIYKNGVLLTGSWTAGSGNSSVPTNTFPVDIGRYGDNLEFFNGLIDEVAVYSRALSESEIQAHYNSGNGAEIAPGVAGSQISDSGNANWGKVNIEYNAKDIDTLTGATPLQIGASYYYRLNSSDSWTLITSQTNNIAATFSTSSYAWDAQTTLSGTYSTTTQVKVVLNDSEDANNIASSTSATFTVDAKNPVATTTLDLSAGTLDFNASDNNNISYRIASTSGALASASWTSVGSNSASSSQSWTASNSPSAETIYYEVRDAYGNVLSGSDAAPGIGSYNSSALNIKDLSSATLNEWKEFIAWNIFQSASGASFGSYQLYRSTDGINYNLLTTITNSSTNSYIDTNVSSSTTYYYKVRFVDSDGDKSEFSAVASDTVDGQGGSDFTAPVISNASSTEVQSTWAKITWTADELSDSKVEYSTDGSYNSSSTNSAWISANATHTVILSGLTPGTAYNFRVKSKDVLNNEGVATGYSFTTASGPVISNVSPCSITSNSASICWTTSVSATSEVNYSLYSDLSSASTATASSSETQHRVELTGLSQGTTYYYQVKSADSSSNLSIDKNSGSYYSFRTTSDTKPPVISDITEALVADKTAVISWKTDEPATSQVEYGTATGTYTGLTDIDSTLTLNHAVTLTGLAPVTKYYYRAKSWDGNSDSLTASSSERTFTTAVEGVVTIIIYRGGGGGAALEKEQDKTAPISSSIKVEDIGSFGSTINFETDEGATAAVEYGSAAGNYDRGEISLAVGYKTKHSVKLQGLLMGNNYHFRIKTVDKSGNIGYSADQNFTTKYFAEALNDLISFERSYEVQKLIEESIESIMPSVLPPFVENPRVSDITENSATIKWRTNIPAYSIVSYASERDYDKTKLNPYFAEASDMSEKKTNHEINLIGLTSNSTYNIKVKSFSLPKAVGESKNIEFTTLASKVKARIADIDKDALRVVWTTDEPSTSIVEYKNIRTGEINRKIKDVKEIEHDVIIENLVPDTAYEIRAMGYNEKGNIVESGESITARTSKDVKAPTISNIKIDNALIPGRTDKIQTVVSWKTDELATSIVEYEEGSGKTAEELANKEGTADTYVENHTIIVTKLKPGALYKIRVVSTDEANNKSVSPTRTIITPRQTESIVDVIVKNFEETFQFLKEIQ